MQDQNIAQNAAQPQEPEAGSIFSTVLRFMLFYILISKGFSYLFSTTTSQGTPSKPSLSFSNLLSDHDLIDFSLFLSENGTETLIWKETSLTYDFSEDNKKEKNVEVIVSSNMINNGTVTLIANFDLYSSIKGETYSKTLTKDLKKYVEKLGSDTFNLISGEIEEKVQKSEKSMHWVPYIDIDVVHDTIVYPSIPPQIADKYILEGLNYHPIIELSDFWVLKEHLIPINDTLTTLNLKLCFNIV